MGAVSFNLPKPYAYKYNGKIIYTDVDKNDKALEVLHRECKPASRVDRFLDNQLSFASDLE